jgi:nucleoside-diphosphate-sugar epimerase|tara:strand:+ start:156 stop:1169 length:1014 start_codon:yes stop_codon:yes gene_type:complete
VDKWFITGGSGFLGSNIIEILKKKNIDFVNFDLLPPEKYKENYLKGDIRDVDSLKIALKGCNKIIHAAASLPLNKKLFTEINVKGTENLVELANYHNIEHFTYISSSSIFGTKNEEIMNEETIPSPVEQYGKSKYLGELVVTEKLDSNISRNFVRSRTIVGKNRLGIFDMLFDFSKNNRPVFLIGNGNNIIQLIDVEEISEVIVRLTRDSITGSFNLGNNDYTTINDTFKNFINSIKSKSKIIHLPVIPSVMILFLLDKLNLSPFGPWHYKSFHKSCYFESSKAYDAINFFPSKNNSEILSESFKHYVDDSGKQVKSTSTHKNTLDFKIFKIFNLFK